MLGGLFVGEIFFTALPLAKKYKPLNLRTHVFVQAFKSVLTFAQWTCILFRSSMPLLNTLSAAHYIAFDAFNSVLGNFGTYDTLKVST